MGRKRGNVLLLRPHGVHAVCEFLRLREIRELALHPDHIRVRRVRYRAVDGALASALVPVVSLPRPRSLPVKEDIHARESLRNSARLRVALSLALLEEFPNQRLLVYVYACFDGVDDGFVEELEVCFFCPGVFDGLEFGACLAGLLGGVHEFAEGLEGGVGRAEDVVVVAGVDGGCDEGGGFGVGAGDGEEVDAFEFIC